MTILLDINVLIARADPAHVFHRRSVQWMATLKHGSIATCPITENGFLRIYGNPAYPGGPGSVGNARELLSVIHRLPQHVFLPDDLSLNERDWVPSLTEVNHSQLTDVYLLALAVKHAAMFATFDRRIDPRLVIGGAQALLLIP